MDRRTTNHNTEERDSPPRKQRRAPRILKPLFLCLVFSITAGCGSDDPGPLGPVTRIVRPDGTGHFTRIQSCIDVSGAGDTCAVYPGTYPEHIRFHGKRILVASTDGPEVTTLDGGTTGTVVQFVDYETRDTVLDGFTIVNGHARIPESEDEESATPRILSSQGATEHGGGVRILSASPIIRNCILRNNTAEGYGGGIFCAFTGSRPRFENLVIHNNTAGLAGGGLYVFSGNVDMKNGLVLLNTAPDGGGIAAEFGARVSLSNSTLADNAAKAANGAAAFRLFNSSASWNDSILGNRSWDPDPALPPLVVLELDRGPLFEGLSPTLNLILDHVNLQGGNVAIRYEGDCSSLPDLCTPEGTMEDIGNPLFVALAGDEGNPVQGYYLSQAAAGQSLESPCVNAGSISAEQAEVDTRTTQNGENGRQLPDGGTVDLGYHYPIVLP